MKTIFLFLAAALLLFGAEAEAQVVYVSAEGDTFHYKPDTSAEIKTFTAKAYSGKIYLKWTAAGQRQDGKYFLFRSCGGNTFQTIGKKEGTGVFIDDEIAYYFTDEMPCSGNARYRIIHISAENTFLHAGIISVGEPELHITKK